MEATWGWTWQPWKGNSRRVTNTGKLQSETDKKVDGDIAMCVFNRVTRQQQIRFWNWRTEIRKGDSEKRQFLGKSSRRSKKENRNQFPTKSRIKKKN